ncbi:Hpt domain-containing protein [Metapseudomonas resinovorans]|uniref:Histidine phosphotransfer protein HptB n=1 Tax=Metapseudomonas resinovorans NBRC 106553 TaxID=1245471 RepID=S6AYB0_METRE|nr:Hpt domain-containing protein [Pseudomonas resinovorans]BAN49726.1 histidine phosphotransfer protein HptB [Pseudomonas resinovorans NBRC 106553]
MSDIHLDHSVLSALRDVMEDEFPVLLDTFLADSTERLRQIQDSQRLADSQALRLAAHSFKGSCSNMGALLLAGLCKQLEDIAHRDQLADAPALILQIEEEFLIVRALMQEERRGLAG